MEILWLRTYPSPQMPCNTANLWQMYISFNSSETGISSPVQDGFGVKRQDVEPQTKAQDPQALSTLKQG